MKNHTLLTFIGCLTLFACSTVDQKSAVAPATAIRDASAGGSIIVSAVQYPIEGGQSFEQFIAKIEASVKTASERKSDLIVFPELITDDTLPPGSKLSESELAKITARTITPRYFEKVKELAKKYQIGILGGTSPRLEKDKVYNTAIFALADGSAVLQNKIFLTGWEVDQGWISGNQLNVFQAPWGKSVILTCYDSEYPLISQKLARAKPEWIFVPSMTTSDPGYHRVRWSSQTRAVEHHAFVVLTGTVDLKPEPHHHGQAALIEPWDKTFSGVVAEGPKNVPAIVTGVLNIESLRQNRAKTRYWPVKTQQDRNVTVVTQ